jgi:hypothetical protein
MKKTLLLLFAAFLTLSAQSQSQYFVAPDGNDTNNGEMQTPFLSIEKAQAEARKANGEVTIYLREGKYRLSRPIVFTPEDSREGKRLTIRSYPGEHAILAGSQPLDLNWKPYKKGIMMATVTPSLQIDMLLADGNIRHMARYPNFDSTAVRFNGTSADATSPRRVKKWKNPEGGYLHAMHLHDWGDFHYRITGKDKAGNLVLEGGWQNNRQSGLHEENRMVENIFEELDAPGEWYYDTHSSILYYYPLPGENLAETQFETPQLKHLIELRGSEQHPVHHIEIQDIELTQTMRTFMEKYEPLLRSDWTVYRGGALIFEGTEDCSLKDSYLHNLGGNAVFFSNYNRRSTVSGTHFTRIGASAVCFVGDTEAVRSPSFEYNEFVPAEKLDRTPGPQNNNYPSHCLVYDNLIHSIGLFEKQITGVELSMCQYITVSHNSIYDTPRAGINISEGTWGGHIIEYNDVFDTVKETGDHGSFNSWGRDRFWHSKRAIMDSIVHAQPALPLLDVIAPITLRNNRFRCDRGWDIDLDDGSSNYHIYNNLCLNGGIKLREGFYRVVENNIMINNSFHPHVWFKNSGDVFTRNIVMTPYLPILVSHWGAEIDYNIFTDSTALYDVRKNKTDEHSIVCPVIFQNPSQGDYRIANSSEAIPLCGFQNFDMDCFGVLSPRLKAIAKTPQFPQPIVKAGTATADIVSWQGLRIKNLETLGERSATGMDSERGVYVVSAEAVDNPLHEFIQPNDVILNLGGIVIKNLEDLRKAIQQIDLNIPQKCIIFRTQKENSFILPGNIIKLKQ